MTSDRKSDYLLTTKAVRERCQKVFDMVKSGQGLFRYHPEKMDKVVDFVHQIMTENYPDGRVPFHSRLGHFRVGGVDRMQWPVLAAPELSHEDRVRRWVDLIIPSVLVDAGAGMAWSFTEEKSGLKTSKSEGLALASLYLFCEGGLSDDARMQTDAEGLKKLDLSRMQKAFQVTDGNPIVGLEGRLQLLRSLGERLSSDPKAFPHQRPSDILLPLMSQKEISATDVLHQLLVHLGPIWPARLNWDGVPLGDTWEHPGLGPQGSFESLVPFHKLSQWLSYSILDGLQLCGWSLTHLDQLTGLPEYRNGGLFLDSEVLSLKSPRDVGRAIAPGETLTIEWRACTVILLDEVARRLRSKLNLSEKELPLVKVLEGGTWWAGRRIARALRPDGGPPFQIVSDGTVF